MPGFTGSLARLPVSSICGLVQAGRRQTRRIPDRHCGVNLGWPRWPRARTATDNPDTTGPDVERARKDCGARPHTDGSSDAQAYLAPVDAQPDPLGAVPYLQVDRITTDDHALQGRDPGEHADRMTGPRKRPRIRPCPSISTEAIPSSCPRYRTRASAQSGIRASPGMALGSVPRGPAPQPDPSSAVAAGSGARSGPAHPEGHVHAACRLRRSSGPEASADRPAVAARNRPDAPRRPAGPSASFLHRSAPPAWPAGNNALTKLTSQSKTDRSVSNLSPSMPTFQPPRHP